MLVLNELVIFDLDALKVGIRILGVRLGGYKSSSWAGL
jgi:hypothetical protein